ALVLTFAEVIAQVPTRAGSLPRRTLVQHLPTAAFRDAAADFLDEWHTGAPRVSGPMAAMALVTAAQDVQAHREEQRVELGWTGPDIGASTFRRTEQALLEVVHSATARLLVVSFAIYHIPRIQEALVAAAQRGVHIMLIVETPHHSEG